MTRPVSCRYLIRWLSCTSLTWRHTHAFGLQVLLSFSLLFLVPSCSSLPILLCYPAKRRSLLLQARPSLPSSTCSSRQQSLHKQEVESKSSSPLRRFDQRTQVGTTWPRRWPHEEAVTDCPSVPLARNQTPRCIHIWPASAGPPRTAMHR